ncbi:energy transducer TonB [Sphingosinithalassobacter portus]|uniref:energy transducer TonB n=1 Tax=Stakelama portus TaxID=2676234 RepID=UPI000D6E3D50|nr:energy transducer TonB [Sphingosinithalassobacter portus]
MYAGRSRISPGSRAASFSAALLINGAMILGIIYAAPKLGITESIKDFKLIAIPEPPPPPDPIAETKPKPETVTEQPVQREIVTPDPIVPTETTNPIEGTTLLPPDLPPIGPIDNIGIPSGGGAGTATPTPTPLPLVDAQVDPRYARYLQPDYPAVERRRGAEGVVVVRVQIGTDGRVKQVQKVRGDNDAFYEATRRQALTRWRFKPATRGDVPQESWKTMTVRFTIEH